MMTDNNNNPKADAEKLWEHLLQTDQEIALYFVYAVQPASVDTLVSLSGTSAVTVLNVMDKLKRKGVALVKKGSKKGIYFLQKSALTDYVKTQIKQDSMRSAVQRIIEHYSTLGMEEDEHALLLADLYKKLGDLYEGLETFKKAGDILCRLGQKTKAADYYGYIVRYFSQNTPSAQEAGLYLDSVISLTFILMHRMPLQEQISLLTRAYSIANQYTIWDRAARIGLWLGRALQDAGQYKKASRYVKHSLNLVDKVGNRELLKTVSHAISEYFVWKGQFFEATRRYEEIVGELEEFSGDEQALMVSQLVGWSHGLCGRISRGLGMIDAVRTKANLLNFQEVANYCDQASAFVLLNLHKIAEARFYLDRLSSIDEDLRGPFLSEALCDHKAYILSLEGKYKEAFEYISKKVALSHSMGRTHNIYPWDFETLRTLEANGFYHENLNFSSLVDRAVNWNDYFLKGVALRYRAIRNMENGMAGKKVLSDLTNSDKCLEFSGAEIELARTRIVIGKYYLARGDTSTAQSYLSKALGFLSTIDSNLFPDDLLGMMPQEKKIRLAAEKMTKINELLCNLKDRSSFLERVVNIAMDFTMAMRGAFIVPEGSGQLKTVASRNLDCLHFETKEFNQVKEFITGASGKEAELIVPEVNQLTDKQFPGSSTEPLICMPVKLGDKVMGYLYLAGTIGNEPFSANQIPFVSMLCSQIAVGLSNISIYEELKEQRDRLEEEAVFYKREMGVVNPILTIIGKSQAIQAVISQIQQVAPTSSSVLILGETGVGKELVAKAIHNLSNRKDGPFIPVNLAALPAELVTSELFGHEKGAFTGANEKHKGRFELAHNGTIFLDEIGDLPLNLQVKLLRVLQEGTFERVGGTKSIRSDFRIIVATNKNLRSEVEKGAFRQDLFYRLNVFPIYVPPLRERKDDIIHLTRYFIDKYGKKIGKQLLPIPSQELKKLLGYHWPGNVRELEHFIERAVILSDGHIIAFSGFKDITGQSQIEEDGVIRPLEEIEREYISKALNATKWRISGPKGAATLLGLKTSTLRSRMEKLGINKTSPAP